MERVPKAKKREKVDKLAIDFADHLIGPRFDGIYQSSAFIVGGVSVRSFLRFWPEGLVLFVSAQAESAEEIAKYFIRDVRALSPTAHQTFSEGRYVLHQSELQFSTAGGSRPAHYWVGELLGDNTITFTIYSRADCPLNFVFCPIPDLEP